MGVRVFFWVNVCEDSRTYVFPDFRVSRVRFRINIINIINIINMLTLTCFPGGPTVLMSN